MRTATQRRADDLARAVADDDQAATDETFAGLTKADLRQLAVELARRAGPSDSDAEIVHAAADYAARMFGTTRESVLSGSRRREDCDARQVACYAAALLGCGYKSIGRQIGRDHSTVMHGCTRVGEVSRLRNAACRIAGRLGWDRGEGAA